MGGSSWDKMEQFYTVLQNKRPKTKQLELENQVYFLRAVWSELDSDQL